MTQFYVYIYRDPSRKNEAIYVGKGQGRRAYDHIDDAQNNHFKNRLAKMKRNGIDPIINVVDLPSEALALQCEIDTIARFGRKDLKLGPLLNQTDGGEGASGRIENAETRRKKADAHKGKKSHLYGLSGDKNYRYGKSHSDKTKQKQSASKKGDKNPNYGKATSAETLKKLSEALSGEKHPFFGKSHTAATKEQLSLSQKGENSAQYDIPKPLVTCPHCGKEGGKPSMSRWHFDNCKSRVHPAV